MLNKLYFYKHKQNNGTQEYTGGKAFAAALEEYFCFRGMRVVCEPTQSGTFGVSYICRDVAGNSFFAKTHLPMQRYKDALRMEYMLFNAANPDYQSHSSLVELSSGQTVFLMKLLGKGSRVNLTPERTLELIASYHEKLAGLPRPGESYDLEALCEEAREDLVMMLQKEIITKKLYKYAWQRLDFLIAVLPEMPRCICHGDLSDQNILFDSDGRPVVIDWEDAFWGIEGYDYINWITFFNHRKFYCKDIFLPSGLDRELVLSLLVLILILKSAISYLNGSFRTNTMGIEERIWEIVTVVGGSINE